MELGGLLNEELRTVGAWLPLGPAPERIHALHYLRERAKDSPALIAEADAMERALESAAALRVRFIHASPWPPAHRLGRGRPLCLPFYGRPRGAAPTISIALMAVTGWRGVTANGEPLEFNARNLRLAAESNPDFAAFAARAAANLPSLTAWRIKEAKKK
ncbi:MAG: hypothetical protein HY804_00140 [Nitrospinae bacterium]|nr:hypothetical protein [Nitrospinota bacterium]